MSLRLKPPDAAPNTIPWPPLIYGAAAMAAIGLDWVLPIGGLLPDWARLAGGVVLVAGAALDCSAMLVMQRHRANIFPHRAATALVTAWPFSMSRNPIYLGNTVMLLGAAPAFHNPWFVAMAIVAVWAVTVLAIQREEAHLAAMFGARWQDYVRHVPRWVGLRR